MVGVLGWLVVGLACSRVDDECSSDEECPNHFACKFVNRYSCVDRCYQGADCAAGYACDLESGLCAAAGPGLCGSDEECPGGYGCFNSNCVGCSYDEETHCIDFCGSNSDCKAGYACDTESGVCE